MHASIRVQGSRAATIAKKVLKRKLRQDSLGEELRVLYVAMTRAEEKLIITGTEHALGAKLKKWKSLLFESRQALPFPGREQRRCVPGMAHHGTSEKPGL